MPNLKTPAKVQMKIISRREFYLKSHTWKKGAVHVKKKSKTPRWKYDWFFPVFLVLLTSFDKIKKMFNLSFSNLCHGNFSLVNDTAPLAVPITLSFKILALKIMYQDTRFFLKCNRFHVLGYLKFQKIVSVSNGIRILKIPGDFIRNLLAFLKIYQVALY